MFSNGCSRLILFIGSTIFLDNKKPKSIEQIIKTAEEKLYFYEEKLELYKKKKLIEDIIRDIDNDTIKNKIREIL